MYQNAKRAESRYKFLFRNPDFLQNTCLQEAEKVIECGVFLGDKISCVSEQSFALCSVQVSEERLTPLFSWRADV